MIGVLNKWDVDLKRGLNAIRIWNWFAPLLLVIAFSGCGSSRQQDRVPVFPAQGTATLEGRAPKGALIVLHPKTANGHAANATLLRPHGTIHSDGSFELTSYETNDGAPVGQYAVTFEFHKIVKYPNGESGPGPNLVPKKYSKPETSPLVVQIVQGENKLSPMVIK